MRGGAGAKGTYHHGNLARALVAEGVRAIEEAGLSSLQVKALAERLGVSHTAVYRHFADREALLRAIAAQGFVRLQRYMIAAYTKSEQGTRRQILDTGYAVVRFARKHPRLSELMMSGILPTAPAGTATEEWGYPALLRLVAAWQVQGVLGAGTPEDLAMSIWVTTLGLVKLIVSGQLGIPRRELRAFVDAVHERMLDGLAPRKPRARR